MKWDERFRVKIERKRDKEEEERKVREWREKEERTMREIEGAILEELERVEKEKEGGESENKSENDRIGVLEKAFQMVNVSEIHGDDEEEMRRTRGGRGLFSDLLDGRLGSDGSIGRKVVRPQLAECHV